MPASSGLRRARYRGLSLDVGRKAVSADGVIGLLGRMSELGFTALHLHLTDSALRAGDGLALTAGPHARLVSDHLGQDVRLARAPRGGVVFAAPVTLVGTASGTSAGKSIDLG